eukprot:CAMPEP_0182443258 /NCGR_PEP_ID=MMETSP1172-20130603/2028_1 /TAXON_ID=708627 /ORGANISM="Timspurckia oligopyrenoides, Strain CCMP3278" /LENGTH=570 /DNA_ID=CAMNT_0024638463 /DNA_START=13 /DNA_END=1725 /DNA_ORIENTATION=+
MKVYQRNEFYVYSIASLFLYLQLHEVLGSLGIGTFIASDSDVLPARVLLQSLHTHSRPPSDTHTIAFLSPSISRSAHAILKSDAFITDIINIHPSQLNFLANKYHFESVPPQLAIFALNSGTFTTKSSTSFDRIVLLSTRSLVLDDLNRLFECKYQLCAVFSDSCKFDTDVLVLEPKDDLPDEILYSYSSNHYNVTSKELLAAPTFDVLLNEHFSDLFYAPMFNMNSSFEHLWPHRLLNLPYRRLPAGFGANHKYFYNRMQWELPENTCESVKMVVFAGPVLVQPWVWWSYGACDLSWVWRKYQLELPNSSPHAISGLPLPLFVLFQMLIHIAFASVSFIGAFFISNSFIEKHHASSSAYSVVSSDASFTPMSVSSWQAWLVHPRLQGAVYMSLFGALWVAGFLGALISSSRYLPLSMGFGVFVHAKVWLCSSAISAGGIICSCWMSSVSNKDSSHDGNMPFVNTEQHFEDVNGSMRRSEGPGSVRQMIKVYGREITWTFGAILIETVYFLLAYFGGLRWHRTRFIYDRIAHVMIFASLTYVLLLLSTLAALSKLWISAYHTSKMQIQTE